MASSNANEQYTNPANHWPVNSQGSYDAHSRARQELWRSPAGEEPVRAQQSSGRRSVDEDGYPCMLFFFQYVYYFKKLTSCDAHFPALEPPRSLMNHQNRSTPTLQYQQYPVDHPPPIPNVNYDTTELGYAFDQLSVAADPVPRSASTTGHRQDSLPVYSPVDPVMRTGTSMSMNATRPPRHAATMPASGWQPNASQGQYNDYQSLDAQPYSAPAVSGSNLSYRQDGSYPGRQDDGNSMYSYDTAATNQYYPQQGYPAYDQSQYNQYNNQDYSQQYGSGYQQYPQDPSGSYAQSQYSADYAGGYDTGGYDASGGYDAGAHPQPSASRPNLERTPGTFADLSSQKASTFKAIDISQQPYTREYIEQYRQRIKGDPDPEAHFAYAKYLIDAAKKVGTKATDQRAVRKYRETLLAEALKTIRRLATQGEAYAEAQFFLASCCGSGLLGLQVDHERAYHMYLQAAKQNHPAASYRVAVCNELGVGTRKDPARAFAFYRKAASLGDTAAMYKLGMILLSGQLGQTKNTREAVGWLKRAAEQADEENPHALHELGLLHEMQNSNIVIHDDAYAKDLFTRAAQLGFVPSQHRLGFCYEYGLLGCPIDPKRSIAWYTKAAEKGDPDAELALSGWYLTGSEGVLPQSDAEAYLWARRAANKGNSKAEFAVGYYAEVGIGVKQDLEFAKRWYMRAAGTSRILLRRLF